MFKPVNEIIGAIVVVTGQDSASIEKPGITGFVEVVQNKGRRSAYRADRY
jgi:hypothetical protein